MNTNEQCIQNKNMPHYRTYIIITIIISTILIIGSIILLVTTFFADNSNERVLITYIEQGIVITLAIISGATALLSTLISKNDLYKQELKNNEREKAQKDLDAEIRKSQIEFEEKWNKKK